MQIDPPPTSILASPKSQRAIALAPSLHLSLPEHTEHKFYVSIFSCGFSCLCLVASPGHNSSSSLFSVLCSLLLFPRPLSAGRCLLSMIHLVICLLLYLLLPLFRPVLLLLLLLLLVPSHSNACGRISDILIQRFQCLFLANGACRMERQRKGHGRTGNHGDQSIPCSISICVLSFFSTFGSFLCQSSTRNSWFP